MYVKTIQLPQVP